MKTREKRRGIGAVDLVVLILILFLLWMAAIHEAPRYVDKAIAPTTPTPSLKAPRPASE